MTRHNCVGVSLDGRAASVNPVRSVWRALRRPLALTSMLLVLSACGARTLMPTPNLYRHFETYPPAAVNPEYQRSTIELMYATDRSPLQKPGDPVRYGHGRSMSLAFGTCEVEVGHDLSWEDLVEQSNMGDGRQGLPIKLGETIEMGRLSSTPRKLIRVDGRLVVDPEVIAHDEEMNELFLKELRRRLALSPKKEAYIFIHGYNNKFRHSAFVMAELWHFMGRQGVPIVYSWPAGKGGLKGYMYDSESGNFTVHHLKQLFKILGQCEELERAHIIAHSRGTDVATSAMRELVIARRASDPGWNEDSKHKVGNVILAAADMDFEVTSQRVSAERVFVQGLDRLTIYVSQHDKALGLADWLFGGTTRIGKMDLSKIPDKMKKSAAEIDAVDIIDAQVKAGFFGHSYFHSNPAVSSDLILMLRDNKRAGVENGRPLVEKESWYWVIHPDYPAIRDPSVELPTPAEQAKARGLNPG